MDCWILQLARRTGRSELLGSFLDVRLEPGDES